MTFKVIAGHTDQTIFSVLNYNEFHNFEIKCKLNERLPFKKKYLS